MQIKNNNIMPNPQLNIKVQIGSLEDFQKLTKLDYTNTVNKMFQVEYENLQIKLSEVDLVEPIHNSNSYVDEISEVMIPKLSEENIVPLVVFVDDQPAGYMLNEWQFWPLEKVMINHGILVANKYARQGLAKKLVQKTIEIAKKDGHCKGLHIEMDTLKYQANKLLLNMGFSFAGTKFFIWHNELPHKNSKEALYFYYKIR